MFSGFAIIILLGTSVSASVLFAFWMNSGLAGGFLFFFLMFVMTLMDAALEVISA